MRSILLFVAAGSFLLSINNQAASLSDMEFITDDYPPYNYEEKGVVKGITVDILLETSKEAGQPLKRSQLKLLPWARGYQQALSGPLVMLFAMSRTESREEMFHWVGPILKHRVAVLAKKASGITIASSDDLKKYSIGAVLDDVGEQILRKLGNTNNVQTSPKPSTVAKKLDFGRIQLLVIDENVARSVMKSEGLNSNEFEVIYTLKETTSFYALSKDVPKPLVKLLQSALDRLKVRNGGLDYNALINGQ